MAEKNRIWDYCEPNDLQMPVLKLVDSDMAVIRECSSAEFASESAIASVIEFRLKTKTLPLTLRKRLMYNRSVAGG